MSDREKNMIETLREGNRELRAEYNALLARAQRAEADAARLADALKMCLPYAKEDYRDEDTGECPYCGGDGDGDHTSDCRQVAAYLAAKKAIAGHNDVLAMKGGEG